jgi:hypothetical protein
VIRITSGSLICICQRHDMSPRHIYTICIYIYIYTYIHRGVCDTRYDSSTSPAVPAGQGGGGGGGIGVGDYDIDHVL